MKKYEKMGIYSWVPLIGFDKNLSDKGVRDLIEGQMGFIPRGIILWVVHNDIINMHKPGLPEREVFPPDICSYNANPYNAVRARQDWTNYDLRELVSELKKYGVEVYISFSGDYHYDDLHKEWMSDHMELNRITHKGGESLNALKRFKDGSYYEDFFAEKLLSFLLDYGMDGVHVADDFCPHGRCIDNGDFTTDTVDQFRKYTGIEIPGDVAVFGDDSIGALKARAEWVWENKREEFIIFHKNRWNDFWKKITSRLKPYGKKTFVLGMYCTDPFETLYNKGVDLKGLIESGVDYLMPNANPNGRMLLDGRSGIYYHDAYLLPFTDAYVDGGGKFNMFGVKDVSEEWNALNHAPTWVDRDINYFPSFFRWTKEGAKRCIDGLNVCLGDGIFREDWDFLTERMEKAFSDAPKRNINPTVLWSDSAFEKFLPEYIKTRRISPHKLSYELAERGAHIGAIVRSEDLSERCGNLLVPDFDLLSEEEKLSVAGYKGGAVIATAKAEGLDLAKYGIEPEIYFEDRETPFVLSAFAFNLSGIERERVESLLATEDNSPILDDPFHAEERFETLFTDMPFQKVSEGFLSSVAYLVNLTYRHLFESTHPMIVKEMEDGAYRLYIFNDDRLHYGKATVEAKSDVLEVKNISKFPFLPVKFSSDGRSFGHRASRDCSEGRYFRVMVAQGGIAVVDVYLKNDAPSAE